ncbi:MAG: carboxypeptidase M32 [Ahrensia sp.]|nr:carboxypeptidase M32 [Ahrensia sp.]
MSNPKAYDEFLEYAKSLRALSEIAANLSWDQEVMMPPAGGTARAEQMAVLAAVAHEKQTDPAYGDQLSELIDMPLDLLAKRNVELAKRDHDRATKVPARLASEIARITSHANTVWAQARSDDDFSAFAPTLETIIALKREEADCIRVDDQSRYAALLNDFEPGMRLDVLQPLLEGLRPRLAALREAIAGSAHRPSSLSGDFDTQAQMTLAREIADVLNYDWNAGRLDLSVHPFSTGMSGDVRITTRLDPANPLDCLYSTIHEIGHALYEQGISSQEAFMPVGHHVSMGVHESQSRLWENQIGRSQAFCSWLQTHFASAFPDSGLKDPTALYRIVNRVETGFIRTEADEVHYNLHILLRFELERELIAGELDVGDLEAEWNRRFERDFGIAVPKASQGVLQDIHWSAGLFGYFPTYALGNIYAAQLMDAMIGEIGPIDDDIANGRTKAVLDWLRSNIHEKGSRMAPDALIESCVGAPVSSEPLLNYLEQKFAALYEL